MCIYRTNRQINSLLKAKRFKNIFSIFKDNNYKMNAIFFNKKSQKNNYEFLQYNR